MRIRTTFWLMVAVLFTGALYLFVSLRDRIAVAPTAKGELVLKLDPDQADLLKVETGGWQVECRKIKGRWRLIIPLQGAADGAAVERILGELSVLPRDEQITPAQMETRGLTPAGYGLEAPAARITLGCGGAVPVVLLLGNTGPFGSSLFVKRTDEPVVIVTRTNILAALPPDVAAFRDRRLLEGKPRAVTRLDVERREGGFVQLAREHNEWRIRQPFEDRADGLRVEALLQSLFATEVEDVVSTNRADPAAYGLGADAVEAGLTIWLEGEEKGTRVELGRATLQGREQAYARIPGAGSVLAVGTNILSLVAFRVSDLRDRLRLRFDPASIRGLEIQAGDRRLAARCEDGAVWTLTEPIQARGDAERIRALVENLASLAAVAFEEGEWKPAAPAPLCQVRLWTNSISGATGAVEQACALRVIEAVSNGENRYRADAGAGPVFLLAGADVYKALGPPPFWDPLRLRNLEIMALNADSVRLLTLVRGEVEQTVQRDEKGHWISHDGRPVKTEAADGIVGAATALRALRLVSPDPGRPDGYGFDKPAARIEFGLAGGEGIRKTLILGGADAEGNRYIRAQGEDLVFVIPPGLADILTRDLFP